MATFLSWRRRKTALPVAVWMWGTETKATLSEVERNMDQICLKQLSGGLRPDYE